MVVVSSHPCAQDIKIYDGCKDDGFSEKLCVIRSATQIDIAKACLDQQMQVSSMSSEQSAAQVTSFFDIPTEAQSWVYTDRVRVVLSPSKTDQKTIIHDLDDTMSKA
jgi:hypothetical protein